MVTSSDGRNLPYGRLEDILSRETSALNCHTNDDRKAWFAIDLGLWLIPNCYTLRHARGYGRSALRNWLFQVCSKNYFSNRRFMINVCLCQMFFFLECLGIERRYFMDYSLHSHR